MEREVYEITMFDEFTITHQGESVIATKFLGKQLVNLFQVLLYYKDQPIHKDKLIEILWTESENPNSVMKFTIFRLRKDIQKISFFKDKELIITTKEGYQLNPAFEWRVDVDEFTKIWEEIKFVNDLDNKQLKQAYRMVQLYKGKYYISNSQLLWTTQVCEFYRQAYVKCVTKICKRLLAEQKYDEMMSLNYTAILLEPFYEGLHYYYMKGLMETSDYHKALKYYDDLNEAFLRELGTGLSDRFKELYNVIMKDHEDINRLELDDLIKDLSTRTEENGGFYCTFDMFKYIYELSVKTGVRENKKYFIISFELINENGSNEEVYGMANKVKGLISKLLRNNDVFAKVNDGQFVVLVNCQSLDNAYLIIQRISKKFYAKFRNKHVRLNYNVAEAVLYEQE
ncbi:MAG: hypothetical protein EOM50_13135 [Erysipelotrichia bacterium]|nr:hypothetical protein [Erysipelotrichia bacterium]NCC55497.1 hypothetical protein [Erysipelotrichia bacterium]